MKENNVGWVRMSKDAFIKMFPYFKGCLWEIDDEGEHERSAWFLIESELFDGCEYPIPKYEIEVTVDRVDNKILHAKRIDE